MPANSRYIGIVNTEGTMRTESLSILRAQYAARVDTNGMTFEEWLLRRDSAIASFECAERFENSLEHPLDGCLSNLPHDA